MAGPLDDGPEPETSQAPPGRHDAPDIHQLEALLTTAGAVRPPVEPDLRAIADRADQRVFRRRLGTGLAVLGLLVPGAVIGPRLMMDSSDDGVTAVAAADCVERVEQFRYSLGDCRYQ